MQLIINTSLLLDTITYLQQFIAIYEVRSKLAALSGRKKDWLALNQVNVSKLCGATCLPVECCVNELAL
jgi:hypothetical protein